MNDSLLYRQLVGMFESVSWWGLWRFQEGFWPGFWTEIADGVYGNYLCVRENSVVLKVAPRKGYRAITCVSYLYPLLRVF
jgi:hypothetical protein